MDSSGTTHCTFEPPALLKQSFSRDFPGVHYSAPSRFLNHVSSYKPCRDRTSQRLLPIGIDQVAIKVNRQLVSIDCQAAQHHPLVLSRAMSSIAAIFLGCCNSLKSILASQEFGSEYELLSTELSIQSLRVRLWGESVSLSCANQVYLGHILTSYRLD